MQQNDERISMERANEIGAGRVRVVPDDVEPRLWRIEADGLPDEPGGVLVMEPMTEAQFRTLLEEFEGPVAQDEGAAPTLLDAAEALLEAREHQMVTRVEWDALRSAVQRARTARTA
ncbi:MAG: hypothetical protein HRU71_12830 [Planctomycetia bacterium]|nr:MAG: hypothetical protein HRU71_12830 [Planctomycetia bacterium]